MWTITWVVGCGGPEGGAPPVDGSTPTDPDLPTHDSGTSATDDDGDGDGVPAELDCDDADPDVYPGAPDRCGDDRVTNCDRTSDDGLVTVGDLTFTSLPDAIGAASPGDTVVVCAGVWPTDGVSATSLTLVAHAGPDVTVLEGGPSRVLDTAGDVTVDGFTVRGGLGVEEGGGLRHVGAGTLTVIGSRVEGNRAERGAGIAAVDGGGVVLTGSSVTDNTATTAGGGLFVSASTVDLGDALIGDNRAPTGGGLALDGATVTGGEVRGNLSEGYGSGGGVYATGGPNALIGSVVAENASYFGAGMYVVDTALVLTDTVVEGNLGDIGDGGGALVERSTLELVGASEFFGNASGFGGGVKLVDASMVGGVVRDNRGAWGGGLEVIGGSTVERVTVSGNRADYGGGVDLYFDRTPPVFVDVTVVDNHSEGYGEGGGLYGYATDPAAVVVWTGGALSGNTTEVSGGGLSIAWFELHLDGVDVVDNTALSGDGGGAALSEARLVLSAGRVAGNEAATGGGVRLAGSSSLDVTGCDFGADTDDNAPEDVLVGGAPYGGYGVDATFTCDPAGCAPAP